MIRVHQLSGFSLAPRQPLAQLEPAPTKTSNLFFVGILVASVLGLLLALQRTPR